MTQVGASDQALLQIDALKPEVQHVIETILGVAAAVKGINWYLNISCWKTRLYSVDATLKTQRCT